MRDIERRLERLSDADLPPGPPVSELRARAVGRRRRRRPMVAGAVGALAVAGITIGMIVQPLGRLDPPPVIEPLEQPAPDEVQRDAEDESPTDDLADTELADVDPIVCEPDDAGTWTSGTSAPVPEAEGMQAVVVDGEVVVIGGHRQDDEADGAVVAYDPATDSWRQLADHPLAAEYGFATAWTGRELLVWGGAELGDRASPTFAEGAAYDPAADTWRELPDLPHGPLVGDAYWTGEEVLVVGGSTTAGYNDAPPDPFGAAFDPRTDQWRILSDPPLDVTAHHTAVPIGAEILLLVQHHDADGRPRVEAAIHDLATDTWRTIDAPDFEWSPIIRSVTTDDEAIVWGEASMSWQDSGLSFSAREGLGAAVAYDPARDAWRPIAALQPPHWSIQPLWTGTQLLLPGNDLSDDEPRFGVVAMDPGAESCTSLLGPPVLGALSAWTGEELVIIGREDPATTQLQAFTWTLHGTG